MHPFYIGIFFPELFRCFNRVNNAFRSLVLERRNLSTQGQKRDLETRLKKSLADGEKDTVSAIWSWQNPLWFARWEKQKFSCVMTSWDWEVTVLRRFHPMASHVKLKQVTWQITQKLLPMHCLHHQMQSQQSVLLLAKEGYTCWTNLKESCLSSYQTQKSQPWQVYAYSGVTSILCADSLGRAINRVTDTMQWSQLSCDDHCRDSRIRYPRWKSFAGIFLQTPWSLWREPFIYPRDAINPVLYVTDMATSSLRLMTGTHSTIHFLESLGKAVRHIWCAHGNERGYRRPSSSNSGWLRRQADSIPDLSLGRRVYIRYQFTKEVTCRTSSCRPRD